MADRRYVYCKILEAATVRQEISYTARLLEAAMRGQKTPVHCKITRGSYWGQERGSYCADKTPVHCNITSRGSNCADRRHRYTARLLLETATARTEDIGTLQDYF
ncbi:hypothetical protein J6590_018566 [Homalodisca vitripennis]|nr:hypothetical protein J6590_018566 [Homalodisca vitripennis]